MKILTRIGSVFRRDRLEAEMAEEMRHHVELQTELNIQAGMNPNEARYAALRQFGNVASLQQQVREGGDRVWLEQIARDTRFAVRSLLKSPGFLFVAVASLALSLGANTAIFSFINGVFLKPLPYAEPDQLVTVMEIPLPYSAGATSPQSFLDWQRQNTLFESIAAYCYDSVSLGSVEEPVQIPDWRVSANYFDILRLHPALGRTFAEGEDQPGKDHVAILSDTLWRAQFGADPKIVGSSIRLDGESYTVIGVLPKGSPLERGWPRLWRPLSFAPSDKTRNVHWLLTIARMKPEVSLEQARAEMKMIGQRIAADFPDSNKGWWVRVDRLSDTLRNDGLNHSLYVLLSAVGMVLLIACANLANLSLMRVVGREREIAVRLSLGATRWMLVRQFLIESLVVALLGGAAGLVVGQFTLLGLQDIMPANLLPPEVDVSLDSRVLLFSFGLTLLTGVMIGLFPALQATRPTLTGSLKQGGVGSSAGSHTRIRSALVVAEIALAFLLLTGAGLLVRSLSQIGAVDPGFNSTNVLTFDLPLLPASFADADVLNNYLRQLVSRLRALPGVTDVALASMRPMTGPGYQPQFQITDQPYLERARRPFCYFKVVSASYFKTTGMHLRKGREFADTDKHGAPPVAVINERMAKKYWPNGDAIGKRILVPKLSLRKTLEWGEDISWEVVGIVADEKVTGQDDYDSQAIGMYVTNEQSPQMYIQSILLRSSVDTALLREATKNAVHEINHEQVLMDMKTLETIKAESLASSRFRVLVLSSFAGISLLLSAIGIYGVISFSVGQRTRELGIRAAFGATRGNVLRLVLRHGMGLLFLGLVIGIAGALATNRLIASMLYGVSGHDPFTLAIVAGILGLVALFACLIPARRAAKVDPVIALRAE
jgi:putative ABC transport system permease protein